MDQRKARQRHALAGQGRLHLLVREVDADPAPRLQLRQAALLQPVGPAEHVAAGAVVVHLDEGAVHEIQRGLQRRRGAARDRVGQAGADHRRAHLAEHADRAGRRVLGADLAQHQVVVGIVQLHQPVGGRDADVDGRLALLEGGQARQQPQRGERREGGQAHLRAAAQLADLAHRAVDATQRRRDGAQQQLAGLRELHAARAAREQRRAQLVLQALDLAADGRLGDVQLLGRGAEARAPGHGLEAAQVVEDQRAMATHVHGLAAFLATAFLGIVCFATAFFFAGGAFARAATAAARPRRAHGSISAGDSIASSGAV